MISELNLKVLDTIPIMHYSGAFVKFSLDLGQRKFYVITPIIPEDKWDSAKFVFHKKFYVGLKIKALEYRDSIDVVAACGE